MPVIDDGRRHDRAVDQPEPFGLVTIEAFARARPVVASATGGSWRRPGRCGMARRRRGRPAPLRGRLGSLTRAEVEVGGGFGSARATSSSTPGRAFRVCDAFGALDLASNAECPIRGQCSAPRRPRRLDLTLRWADPGCSTRRLLGEPTPDLGARDVGRVGEVDDPGAHAGHARLQLVALGCALPVVALEDDVEVQAMPHLDLVGRVVDDHLVHEVDLLQRWPSGRPGAPSGSLPLTRRTASSVTTPTISQSQCGRACLRMFRCPMWNMSQAPGTYPTIRLTGPPRSLGPDGTRSAVPPRGSRHLRPGGRRRSRGTATWRTTRR